MANNSSSPICWQPDWFWDLGLKVDFAQNAIILPMYATVGLFGHLLLAFVFLKQAKNEKAYMYQIFLELTECLENVVFSLLMLSFLGAGIESEGYIWFQKVYFLMWYAAHMAIPMCHAFSVSCLLLSISMSADRVFALFKPFVYKSINRKKHQILALTLSLIVGFGTTVFNIRLFEVEKSADHYVIGVDGEFVESLTSTVLSHACNVTRMVGLLILIVCNLCIVLRFRQHMSQKTKISITKSSTKERTAEKSLLLLTIAQSFFMTINMFSYVVFYTAAYAVPLFIVCDQKLYAPLLNSILMTSDLVNTCVVVALNQKSRNLLLKAICFNQNSDIAKVGPSTTSGLLQE